MRLILIFIFLSFMLPTLIWGQNAVLKGTVTTNDRPMEGAVIFISGSNQGTVTDAHGHYTIENLQKGQILLSVSMIGYTSIERNLDLSENELKILDFDLEQDALNLSQVVITGTRSQIRQYNSPVIVNTISNRTFESTQSLTLSEGLSFTPGLRLENNCQNCGFTQLRMNGLDGSYSQILINSRPVFSALAGVYGLEMLPTSIVDRVEVVRGGGSALYGGNAIAGTVNIITKDPVDQSFKVGMNQAWTKFSAPDRTITVNGTMVSENLNSGIAIYGYNRSREPWDANEDGFSEMTKLENNTFGFDAFWNLNANTKIKAGIYSIDEFRRGGNDFDLPPHQSDITEQLDHKILGTNISLEHYSLNYKHKFSVYTSSQRVKRDSYYGGGGRILSTNDSLTNDDILSVNAYGISSDISIIAGIQYVYDFSKNAIFTTGIENQYNAVTDQMPGYGRKIDQNVATLGNYAQIQLIPIRKLTLLLGGRFDHVKVDGYYDLEDEKLRESKALPVLVPRISAMYALSENLKARISFAQGYRAPQAFDEDLHIETVGGAARFIKLSPDLLTERSNSFTSSLNYARSIGQQQFNLVFEGFYSHLENPFILADPIELPSGVAVLTKRNGSGATVAGINLEANYAFSSQFIIQSGATFQTARYEEPEEIWKPLEAGENQSPVYTRRILRTPNSYGYFNMTYNPIPTISLTYSGIFTGTMDVPHVINPNTEQTIIKKTPSFFENNFKVGYTLNFTSSHEIQIFAGVQNLLNSFQKDFDSGIERDAAYIYGPARPRTGFVGLTVGFN